MYELQLFASEIKFQDHLDLERIMPGKCNTLLSCPDHPSIFLHLQFFPLPVQLCSLGSS